MSEKWRKHSLSKNEDIKTVRHFEENNYQGDDLHANLISLLNVYEHLKCPPPVHSLNFSSYATPMFSIFGLKFKMKSKF